MRTRLGLVEGGEVEMRAEVVVTNQWGTTIKFCESSEDSALFEFTMRMRVRSPRRRPPPTWLGST